MALTDFQTKCEASLQALLTEQGRRLDARSIMGTTETYIRARISGTDLTVYVYEDEAQIHGSGVTRRFEAPDYESSEELLRAFVAEIDRLVMRQPA